MQSFIEDFQESKDVLQSFIAEEKNFKKLKEAGDIMVKAIQKGNKIISCGNGGSMCDAMHFAEELTGRYRKKRAYPAIAITDPSHLTCVENDFGYDKVFFSLSRRSWC